MISVRFVGQEHEVYVVVCMQYWDVWSQYWFIILCTIVQW